MYKPVSGAQKIERTPVRFSQVATKTGRLPNRLSQFVVVSNAPRSTEPNEFEPMYYAENLSMAHSTIALLQNLRHGGRVCPEVISSGQLPNAVPSLYSLVKYTTQIQAEKQSELEFHVVGHGSPDSIGLNLWYPGVPVLEFAHQIIDTLDQYTQSTAHNLKSKPLHFVFRTCNSAYCYINRGMLPDEVNKQIMETSFIGQFYSALRAAGYTDIYVSGFRGYYQETTAHSGATVLDAYMDADTERSADLAKYTIFPDGTIVLPKKYDFNVRISSPFKVLEAEQVDISDESQTTLFKPI